MLNFNKLMREKLAVPDRDEHDLVVPMTYFRSTKKDEEGYVQFG